MGFKTSKDVEERLNSPDNLPNKLVIIDSVPLGRGKGNKEVPLEIKKLAAIMGQTSSVRDVSESLGLGKEAVYNYTRGMTHRESGPNQELVAAITESSGIREVIRETASDKAISALLSHLNVIETESVGTKKSKIVSSVAKDLAHIHETLRKKSPLESAVQNGGGIQFHLHVPSQKKLEDYDVVDV